MRARMHNRLSTAAAAGRLCTSRLGRIATFLVVCGFPLKMRIAPGLAVPIAVSVAGRTRRFYVADPTEIAALRDILLDAEYPPVRDARVIVDLGANAGQAALWLRAHNPGARILCVEPDLRTVRTLRRNVADDEGIDVRHCAVTGVDGPVEIRRTLGESWGSRTVPVDGGASAAGDVVEGLTLDRLLADAGLERVDLLKVDIEGAEFDVLTSAGSLTRVERVIGELHPDMLPVEPRAALDAFRAHGGFESARLDETSMVFELAR